MDSKQINKAIHKNKYQMPNIDVLLDNVAQSAQEGNKKKGQHIFLQLTFAMPTVNYNRWARNRHLPISN